MNNEKLKAALKKHNKEDIQNMLYTISNFCMEIGEVSTGCGLNKIYNEILTKEQKGAQI